MQTMLSNLQNNGYAFKQFINTISFLNLYLNVYRHDLTNMYRKQIISDTTFLKDLWMPFVTDIFINKIGTKTKATFSAQNFNNSYGNFMNFYKGLGNDLTNTIRAVFMAFFTSQPIEQPQEIDTGPTDVS